MKLFNFVLFLLVLSTPDAIAQNFKWARTINSSNNVRAYKMYADQVGNSYVGGTFYASAYCGSTTLYSNNTIAGFICKLDPSGNFKWANKLESTSEVVVQSITVDLNGRVTVCGDFKGTMDANPNDTIAYNMTSAGYEDVFAIQLDSNGNFLWAKQFGNSLFNFNRAVVGDNSGSIYLTTYFLGSIDANPDTGTFVLSNTNLNYASAVIKLDSNGKFYWALMLKVNYGMVMIQDIELKKNQLILTGNFNNNGDFNPKTGATDTFKLTPNGMMDAFILKLDTTGGFVWAKNIGSPYNDYGTCVGMDDSLSVYSSGNFINIADLDPGTPTKMDTAVGNGDYLVKLNGDGSFNFGNAIQQSSVAIAVDKYQNYYQSGDYADSIILLNSNQTKLISNGGSDILITKRNSKGQLKWSGSIGGTNSEGSTDLRMDGVGNFFNYGTYNGNFDFDPSSSSFNLNSGGKNAAYIQKFCITPEIPTLINPNDTIICYGDSIKLLVTGENIIWYTLPSGGQKVYEGNDLRIMSHDSIKNLYAQDSIACGVSPRLRIQVRVKPKNSFYQEVFICKKDTIKVGGVSHSSIGVYQDTLLGSDGCDSFVVSTIKRKYYSDTTRFNICNGKSFQIKNKTYWQSGTYIDTIYTNDCDTISVLIIDTIQRKDTVLYLSLCPGRKIKIGMHDYDSAGIYFDTLNSSLGCDSFIRSVITISPYIYVKRNFVLCPTEFVVVNSKKYSLPNSYFDTIRSNNSCDTVLNTVIVGKNSVNSSQYIKLCHGDTFRYRNHKYFSTGVFFDTLVSKFGCDSVVTTNLIIKPKIDTSIIIDSFSLRSNQSSAKYQWVECRSNSTSNITAAKSQVYRPKKSGRYACQIIFDSCTLLTPCIQFQFPASSIVDIDRHNLIEIYPIPASKYFEIQSEVIIQNIEVYNLQNVLVKKYTKNDISQNHFDIQELNSNIYIAKITDIDSNEFYIKLLRIK